MKHFANLRALPANAWIVFLCPATKYTKPEAWYKTYVKYPDGWHPVFIPCKYCQPKQYDAVIAQLQEDLGNDLIDI